MKVPEWNPVGLSLEGMQKEQHTDCCDQKKFPLKKNPSEFSSNSNKGKTSIYIVNQRNV